MNTREISEIRRRFNAERSNITAVRGCYVNSKKEILAEFNEPLSLMPDEEREQIFALLRKVLSGTPGRNLFDVDISTQQVMSGEEHKLLMAMRESSLNDADAVRGFYEKVIESVNFEQNFMILLAYDAYDVPFRAKDGETDRDSSETLFKYIVCAVCPLKMTKPALGFHLSEQRIRNIAADWIISPPEFGFTFPAFDSRAANIYAALYYTRSTTADHSGFIDAVFRAKSPMPAAEQDEIFKSIIGDAVAEDCSLEVVQAVRGKLGDMAAAHKETREPNPLRITKETVQDVLEGCGVSEEHVAAFGEKYDVEFGAAAEIPVAAVVDSRPLEVSTPDVVIHVNPERGDLIETRVIDGARYILVRAEEDVKVSGISIHIPKD